MNFGTFGFPKGLGLNNGLLGLPIAAIDIDTDAFAVIQAIGTLTERQKNAIINRITNAKSDGVWSKWIAYYGFVGGTAGSHAINWKNPSSYLITWIGTLTHNATGVKGNGSTGYGDTGISPSVLLNNSSLHLAAHQTVTKTTLSSYELGCLNDAGTNGTYLVNQNGILYFQNGLTSYVGSSNIGNTRAYLAGNVLSGIGKTFKNNTLIDTASFSTSSANSLINKNIFILNLNYTSAANYKSDAGLGSVLISEGLTDGERDANYASELTFQTALGRN